MALTPRVEAIPRILQRPSCLRARPRPGGAGHGSSPRSPGKGCFRRHCACPSYLAASPLPTSRIQKPPPHQVPLCHKIFYWKKITVFVREG